MAPRMSPPRYPVQHPLDGMRPQIKDGTIDAVQQLLMQMGMGGHGGDGDYMEADATAQAQMDVLRQMDPKNANPNARPAASEDSEDGYWDAQNRGNGRGSSFLMEKGQQRAADPVGKGAMIDELMAMIGPDAGALVNLPPGHGGLEAGPDRMEDPAFADAYQEWTDEMGHEPATDGEFAEVEAWAAQMADSERAYDKRNPR